jgi:glutamate N-acetyltransferase/amino-acid N-acetyltransferase
MIQQSGGLDIVEGFFTRGVHCGIKKSNNDLAIIFSEIPATAAAVFTTNQVCAAPVNLTRRNLEKHHKFQLVVINSGVANACTGSKGVDDAIQMAQMAAREFNIKDPSLVAVASTGVIGDFLPLNKIEIGIKKAHDFYPDNPSGHDTARAIMTTDTFKKEKAVSFFIDGQECNMAGIAKGSGMIKPNMATMLGFIITDAAIDPKSLQKALKGAVDMSFNRVTVDGDTSTNDMVLLMANGKRGKMMINENHPDFFIFQEALNQVCQDLAKDIARDGEGATKFINVVVQKARNESEARAVAFTVAESPLVKTAFFGEDPNWGRIMAAVGRSGISIQPEKINIVFNGVPFVEEGMGNQKMTRNELRTVVQTKELEILIDLGLGSASFNVWTCDFSYDYVKINSHYS